MPVTASMARPLRVHVPGMLYHVMSRGNAKQCIFTDATDNRSFLVLLACVLARFGARCPAYCLMWNHYHLLLRAGWISISRVMHQVNSDYCRKFNLRHGRVGHVLQGRFKAPLVEDGAATRRVLRYLALNPVEAGYVAKPEDYAWGSFRAAMGLAEPPEFLAVDDVWSAFGASDPAIGRARLAEFVRAGMQEDGPDSLLIGSERLKRRMAPLLAAHQIEREHAYAERYAARPSLGTLFEGPLQRSRRSRDSATGIGVSRERPACWGCHAGSDAMCVPSSLDGLRTTPNDAEGASLVPVASPEDTPAQNKI